MCVGNLQVCAPGAAKPAANLATKRDFQSAIEGASCGKEDDSAPRIGVHASEGGACLRRETKQRWWISAKNLCPGIQTMSGKIYHARARHVSHVARHRGL